MSTEKKRNKHLTERMLDEAKEAEEDIGFSRRKGNWKVQDGDWIWVPTDDRGVPLTDEGRPVLPQSGKK